MFLWKNNKLVCKKNFTKEKFAYKTNDEKLLEMDKIRQDCIQNVTVI